MYSILFIQKSKVFMLYKMKERSTGDNVIPEESLKYYLEQSRAFLGEKNMRYFVYPSIVTTVLRLGPDDLLKDLHTMGLFFEAMCVRDLRVVYISIIRNQKLITLRSTLFTNDNIFYFRMALFPFVPFLSHL